MAEAAKTKEKRVNLDYVPSGTIFRMMGSKKFVRGIRGPRASGKSSGCCQEIMSLATHQAAGSDGVRRVRVAIVRNTYRELEDTTIKTWLHWFPEEIFGRINRGNLSHHLKFGLADGTFVDLEVMFRSLDQPKDIKKLLSLELTLAYVNEAKEIYKGLVDGLGDCVGRYPAIRDGGPTQYGIIMDTNSPDSNHWWYRLESNPPAGWDFFVQPGGLLEVDGEFVVNPEAENLENLMKPGQPNYYLERMEGKEADWIRVYYCNQFGFVKEGKPVIPEYVDARHCLSRQHVPEAGAVIYVGLDFGRTPAAVFLDYLPTGRWVVFDELCTEDMGAVTFAEVLGHKLRGQYGGHEVEIYGDPSGDSRNDIDENTPFMILAGAGIVAERAPSNDFSLRREAIAQPLRTLAMDGFPRLMVSPNCEMIRSGLAGGYHYRRMQIRGQDTYREKPTKNAYSHPVEGLGYVLLGAGEGDRLVESRNAVKISLHLNERRPSGMRARSQGWMLT